MLHCQYNDQSNNVWVLRSNSPFDHSRNGKRKLVFQVNKRIENCFCYSIALWQKIRNCWEKETQNCKRIPDARSFTAWFRYRFISKCCPSIVIQIVSKIHLLFVEYKIKRDNNFEQKYYNTYCKKRKYTRVAPKVLDLASRWLLKTNIFAGISISWNLIFEF